MSTERRNQPRTDLHVPLYLLSGHRADVLEAETENISLNGFFFYSNVMFVPGEPLKFLLLFPETARDSQITRATYLNGVAEVTHVSMGRGLSEFGIGCHMEEYRVHAHMNLWKTEDVVTILRRDEVSHDQGSRYSDAHVYSYVRRK